MERLETVFPDKAQLEKAKSLVRRLIVDEPTSVGDMMDESSKQTGGSHAKGFGHLTADTMFAVANLVAKLDVGGYLKGDDSLDVVYSVPKEAQEFFMENYMGV